MSSVQVCLDNYNNCCYPGQTITGRVECYFNIETKVRAIRLQFKGKSETEWSETETSSDSSTNGNSTSRSVRYHAEEEYLNEEYNLVQGVGGFLFPPGKRTYPFSYILPAHLPSSFEGKYGHVRYYIMAIVDRSWKFNYEYLLSLNVVSPLDLNYVPGVRDPVATSVDKTICSCCCRNSGELTFEMSLPATGFVPGQEMNIGAHVENMSNVNVECVKFEIIGKLEFITHSPRTKSRYDEKVIVSCKAGGIGAHGDKSWTSSLTIPSHISYPNLIPCSIINLSYLLKAKVVIPWPHINLKNKVPLVIGTVPLAGVVTTFSASPPTVPAPTERTPLLPNATPYLSERVPYISSTSSGYGAATPYPSAPSVGAPYPPGPGGAPYPQGGSFNPSAPSALKDASDHFSSNSLPSYEEAKRLKEKK